MRLKKGPWTPQEDGMLLAYIQRHGHGSWRSLPSKAGLERCGKSCRLRWINYLRPDIKRGNFSFEEERTIIQLHALLGNRWSAIAGQLSKRTDNEIKNYWNTHLKKKLMIVGIDPTTHKPTKYVPNISHMAQWEMARLQAEARLVRQSNLPYYTAAPPPLPLPPPPCLDVLKVWEWTNPGKDISTMVLNPPENTHAFPITHDPKGIMENSMEFHPDSLGFNDVSSSDNALGSCWGINSWSNNLNVTALPMDSPMF